MHPRARGTSLHPSSPPSREGQTKKGLLRSDSFRLDLGLRKLIPEWKQLLSPRDLKDDIVAGITVACIAIPLSLAIALASGVDPAVGLITAIVAGVVVALFNGTPLAVSGPAAAMAVLIASVVQQFGIGGLLVVGLGTGILQVLTGVFGLGKLIRFVPVPVVAGFTAGIGGIILIGQLPRALGLPPPAQSHVFDVITHLGQLLHETNLIALGLTMTTLVISLGLPKVLPKLPAPLIGVVVPTIAVFAFGLKVPTIGALPSSLPMPQLPTLPTEGLGALLGTTLVVYALASLETLLSSGAVDKLTRGHRHDPDQELIGQGIGNAAVAMFGGIPVTGVIARSALNVQAGAKTRRSAIIHAIVLLVSVLLFAGVMSAIPIAALAGVLLSVALRMLNPRELIALWRVSRSEGAVYLVTFAAIVLVDLMVGIQAGVLAALFIAAIRLGQVRTMIHAVDIPGPHRVSLAGPITFLSSSKLEMLRAEVDGFDPSRGVVVDMSGVTAVDSSGAEMFTGFVENLHDRNIKVALQRVSPPCREALSAAMPGIEQCFAVSESDVRRVLDTPAATHKDRLVHGVRRFRWATRSQYQEVFDQLANGQEPHTLFITCSDSRINPNLITSTDPGELFIVRNVGNMVPRDNTTGSPGVGAAIEYAIGVLGVKEVVVCGHTACGAMKALLDTKPTGLHNVDAWLSGPREELKLPVNASPEEAARINVLRQLEHLRSYPIVRERLASGALRLHGWIYDVGAAELIEWDEELKTFRVIGAAEESPAAPRTVADEARPSEVALN